MPTNPCCCEPNCTIFDDIFDQEGDVLAAHWNVLSGTMTLDSATNKATIAGGSVIGPTTDAPSGSAGFHITADWPDATTSVKFAFTDSSNHWRVDITGGFTVFAQPALLIEVFEVIGGVDMFAGSRYFTDSGGAFRLQACWGEDDRMRITFNTTTYIWAWPNNVTGGDSFRVEPTDDLEVTSASWVKSEADIPSAGLPCCNYPNCMLCADEEWGDTMQIEALDGEDMGETFIVDRHLDGDTYPGGPGAAPAGTLGYWRFNYVSGEGASDYTANLSFCIDGNDDTEGRLQIVTDGSPGSGTVDFVPPDCVGPWDVVVGGVTYRITLL